MQAFYCYIILLGVCFFLTQTSSEHFRGSNGNIKSFLIFFAWIGILSFLAIIITSFFYIPWWHSVLLLLCTMGICGFVWPLGKNTYVGFVSSIGIIVFNILAWIGML